MLPLQTSNLPHRGVFKRCTTRIGSRCAHNAAYAVAYCYLGDGARAVNILGAYRLSAKDGSLSARLSCAALKRIYFLILYHIIKNSAIIFSTSFSKEFAVIYLCFYKYILLNRHINHTARSSISPMDAACKYVGGTSPTINVSLINTCVDVFIVDGSPGTATATEPEIFM